MSRTDSSGTTGYIWDVTGGATLLQEMTGSSTTTYVYGLGLISTTDSSGNETYFLKDGLGNTVALSDASGNVTATYAYDVFGAVRSHTGTESTEFTFTGEDNDPNGLEYLRARYYDNATGRFISRDPARKSANWYIYANDNPVNALIRAAWTRASMMTTY